MNSLSTALYICKILKPLNSQTPHIQLYFMISPREVPNLTCDYLDKLARLYCDLPGTVTHYRYTIPLGDLKKALLERDRRFSELPNNLEIHEIT